MVCTLLLFSALIYNMEGKSSPLKTPKSDVFLTLTCQLKMSSECVSDNMTVLTVKIFHHQSVAYLPENATEIVRFLKRYELCVFETVGFFLKKKLDR